MYEIEDRRINESRVRFDTLEVGEFFYFDDDLFMVTEEGQFAYGFYNEVIERFDINEQVVPVEVRIIIEKNSLV